MVIPIVMVMIIDIIDIDIRMTVLAKGSPLLKSLSVYVGIAEIAFDPPPPKRSMPK